MKRIFKIVFLTNQFRVKHSLVNSYIASVSIDKLPDGFFETLNPVTQLISVEPEPVKQLIKLAESKEDVVPTHSNWHTIFYPLP